MNIDRLMGTVMEVDIDLNRNIDHITISFEASEVRDLLTAAIEQMPPSVQKKIEKSAKQIRTALWNRMGKIDIEFTPMFNSERLRERKAMKVVY